MSLNKVYLFAFQYIYNKSLSFVLYILLFKIVHIISINKKIIILY